MEMYDITSVDTCRTTTMSEQDAIKLFGRPEWEEIKKGHLPHIVAIKASHVPLIQV